MFTKKEKTTKERLNEELELYKADIEKQKQNLSKELELYKADIEKQKQNLSKELELYKAENYLSMDKDIQDRKHNNWKSLDEVRFESYKQMGVIKAEIAKLEGHRDSLKLEISKNQSEEILRLNNIILELIKNQNKQVICQPQK